MLQQKKAEKLLRKYSIQVARSEVHKSRKSAVHTALKFPVVLKASSDEIVHKTDVGGVITNIKNQAELAQAITDMHSKIRKTHPGAEYDYLLQSQEPGKEIIIGMKRDEQFGPVILFGMGGIFVEVFKDVSLRVAPLSTKDIKEMITSIKAFEILKGFRGEPGVSISAIADVLKKVSVLSLKEKDIKELDFNPVMVNEKRALVVDVRIIK